MTRGDRSEALPRGVLARLEQEVATALRRRSKLDQRLSGVLRVLAPVSDKVRGLLVGVATALAGRGAFDRELFGSSVRALSEEQDKRVVPILGAALSADDGGGLAVLSSSCFVGDKALGPGLTKVASSRHSHLAFAAEVARLARGESQGMRLGVLAPKIKEAHRIALCLDVFVPLTRARALPLPASPALAILRDAERHLGRWLVLAQVATLAGDPAPLAEAISRSSDGPLSSQAAWTLVAWALDSRRPPPATRPTLELVARLSDRPSADRDTTFLFRLAGARASTVRPILESICKPPLTTSAAIRAALHLARDHERRDLIDPLCQAADSSRNEDLRGVATAALWDLGEKGIAAARAETLCESKSLESTAWAALVCAAQSGRVFEKHLVSELRFRRIESGWTE